MQVWYIILGIGTLLFITTIASNIAEAIERREQEKKIKVLKLKREIDFIGEYLQQLKDFDLPAQIIHLLESEVLARFEKIKLINKNYEDIDDLISESKERLKQETIEEAEQATEPTQMIISEDTLKRRLNEVRQLLAYIDDLAFMSAETRTSQLDYTDILITFRFEKLNSFYSKHAQKVLLDNNYDLARECIEKISNGIMFSEHSNSRLLEIKEQASMVLEEIEIQRKQYEAEIAEKKLLEEEQAIKIKEAEEKAAKKKSKAKKH